MLSKLFRPNLIIGTLPVMLANGTTADATQVMSDLNYVVNQVNANAAPLANPTFTGTLTAAAISLSGTITGNAAMLSPITNSLGANVVLVNQNTFYDGPSVAQGTSGTWFVSGNAVVTDTVGAAQIKFKLWDGTTLIDSLVVTTPAASNYVSVSLSGYITSPAGDIRISASNASRGGSAASIFYNASGLGKDSTITAIRIG